MWRAKEVETDLICFSLIQYYKKVQGMLETMSIPVTIKFLSFDHPDAASLSAEQQLEIKDVKPIGTGVVASAANIPVFVVVSSINRNLILRNRLRWYNCRAR